MTVAEIVALARQNTNTNSTTFPNADVLVWLNQFLREFREEIGEINEGYFLSPYTTDLVADQREYALPTDMLTHFNYLEANFTGNDGDWVKLEEIFLSDFDLTTDEQTILSNYANSPSMAKFLKFRQSVYLLSGAITNVTDGLKIWVETEDNEVTDATDTTDMAASPYWFPKAMHRLLGERIGIAFKENQDRPVPLTQSEQAFYQRKQMTINRLSNPNRDRTQIRQLPNRASVFYGNNGYDF